MPEEWLSFLKDNAPDLYEEAIASIKHQAKWRDDRIRELEDKRDDYHERLNNCRSGYQALSDRISELEQQLAEYEDRIHELRDELDQEQTHIADLEAEVKRLKRLVDDCRPYLKRHETPAQCIQRNRDDAARALKMLAEEKRILERVKALVPEFYRDELQEALNEDSHVVSPETIAAIKCVTGQNEELADD